MATLSTHILDTSVGLPAPGVRVVCERKKQDDWHSISEGVTDDDGRVKNLSGDDGLMIGEVYRLRFEIADYFKAQQTACFYPLVEVQFCVDGDRSHYHVPLLLNPYGYSTYRGS